MGFAVTSVSYALLGFAVLYLALMGYLLKGWFIKGKPFNKAACLNEEELQVSVLVPFRNERENLPTLVKCLRKQDFVPGNCEFLFINDHSTDEGEAWLTDEILDFPAARIIHLQKEEGKKAALAEGIAHAKGQLILTLDADVEVGERWLRTILEYYCTHRPKLLVLPVRFKPLPGLWFQLLELEFYALIGTTISAVKVGHPLMCNGANLAFERQAFEEVNGYAGNAQLASGDDVFLLHKVKRKYPRGIHQLCSKAVIATTAPPMSFKTFIHQRLRWGGKASAYRDPFSLLIAGVVLGINLGLLVGAGLSIFNAKVVPVLLGTFLLKLVIDWLYLLLVTQRFGRKKLLWLVPFEALLYPFYIVGIGLLGMRLKPSWKGRQIK